MTTAVYIRDYRTEIPGGLTPDRITWEFPTVSSKNTHGRESFWKIYVRCVGEVPILDAWFDSATPTPPGWIKVDSGLVGGKTKESVPTIVAVGKNLGKASATNAWTQALRQALGLYNKQVKKSAQPATAGGVQMYPPMLAKIHVEVAPDITAAHPAFVQRKYNGVRTVAAMGDAGVVTYSRRRTVYPDFSYIKAEIGPMLRDGIYLDGEIYEHGVALQEISGHARLTEQPEGVRYHYMVYDCFDPARPALLYSERKEILDGLFVGATLEYAKNVETFVVRSPDEVAELYTRFIAEGYEGAMVRLDTTYQYSYNDHHSDHLLKIKPSFDAEYEIVGWETGTRGKAAAALMIVCKTPGGIEFPVTPAMEIAERVALAAKMASGDHFKRHWLGRPLIVTYDEKSKDGVPQRARTHMEIRTWE